MLLHLNYQPTIIDSLEKFIKEKPEGLWDRIFKIVIGIINDESDSRSERLAMLWVNRGSFLHTYSKMKNISSLLLYNLTKKDQYLPQEAVDVFLF